MLDKRFILALGEGKRYFKQMVTKIESDNEFTYIKQNRV